MNDIDKLVAGYEYIRDLEKIKRDMDEFVSTFDNVVKLISDPEMIKKMTPFDLMVFLVSAKQFNDEIKPIVIKYGILPNIADAMRKDE